MEIAKYVYLFLISIISLVFSIFIIKIIFKNFIRNSKSKNKVFADISSNISNDEPLKKISTRTFLFGLESKLISDEDFYFDDENFYAINIENKKAVFKLTDITEISKTFIEINDSRIWQIKIKPQGSEEETIFKFVPNYSLWNKDFLLFYGKLKLINPSIVKSKWSLWTN